MQMVRQRSVLTAGMAAVFAAAMSCAAPVLAAPSVQERLDALERKVDARGLIDLLTQVEQLQRTVQQLRGDIEVQNHRLDELQQSQRDQYLDIDRRLRALEGGAVTPSAGLAPLPGAVGMDTPPVAPVSPSDSVPPAAPVSPPPAAAGNDQPFDFSPAAPAAPPVAVNPVDEKAEYDTALGILRDGRYSDAALAFKQFINSHPTGAYSDNAHYWLGETYYVTRDFDQAQATFRALVSNFPQSSKVADSRLKLGFIYYEKKDWKAARAELEAVANTWPTSTAARLANERLNRMKQEKH